MSLIINGFVQTCTDCGEQMLFDIPVSEDGDDPYVYLARYDTHDQLCMPNVGIMIDKVSLHSCNQAKRDREANRPHWG